MMELLQLKLEERYGSVVGEKEEDEGEVVEARKEKDSVVEEARTAEGGLKDEEEEEDEDQEDDEDPKPRSFGKVAMASPQGGSADSSRNPPFPTVFASISLVSQVCPRWLLILKTDLLPEVGILSQSVLYFLYTSLIPELTCSLFNMLRLLSSILLIRRKIRFSKIHF